MFESNTQKNWTITALVLFAISFVAFSWISRRPLCIDSRIIEKLERIDGKQATAVYRCSARRTVSYDDVLARDLFPLSRRVHDLEKFLETLQPLQKPVVIKILESTQKHFRVVGSELQISRDYLSSEGQLEKGILKIWLREQLHTENTVYEESLSDLMMFVMTGSVRLGDEDLASSDEFQQSKWPFVAKGLKSYCESSWKSLEHGWFCSQEIKIKSKAFVSMSVRPLLTSALIESYMDLKLKERSQLMGLLSAALHELNPEASGRGYSAFETSQQNLVDLSGEISALLQALQDLQPQQAVLSSWTEKIKRNLEIKGFTSEPLETQVDLLLHIALKDPLPLIEAVSKTQKKGLTVLASNDEDYFFLPGLETISKKAVRSVRAQRVIYWTCEAPTLSELMRYSTVTTRLLLVEDCQQKPSLSLASSLQKGIESFMMENPKVSFVDLHLPSLHFAIENKKLESESRLLIASLTSSEMQKILQKQLGWREQSFDKNLNFYQVQSDIEAIKAFRP